MANWLIRSARAGAQAIVGLLLIAAAGVAALAMLLISSLVVAAGLMLRLRPKAPAHAPVRSAPPVLDAHRTPYGWTTDVSGPRA